MAKYFASTFGTIVGKVNGNVGRRWRGINIITKYTVPSDKGTLLKYQQMKDGIITPDKFSFPQFNLRRLIVNPIMHMGRHNTEFIDFVWNTEVKARHLQMGGLNLMAKENITQLYGSIDKNLEFDPVTNSPDITKMIMSTGILEGTSSLSATYNPTTGIAALTWDTDHYTNGADTDYAGFIIVKKPLLESYGRAGNWQPALAMYFQKYNPPPGLPYTRASGTGEIAIDTGLDPDDLTAFIFFFTVATDKTLISISLSSVVTTPP
jgi:hypothetical protein